IVARLAPVPANYADVIPPFNPFKLYDSNTPIGTDEDSGSNRPAAGRSDVSVRVVELLGGILPGEDGQEIDAEEARELVARSEGSDTLREVAAAAPLAGSDPALLPLGNDQAGDQEARAPNTTILAKSSSDGDDLPSEIDALKPVVKTVRDGQKLTQVLV